MPLRGYYQEKLDQQPASPKHQEEVKRYVIDLQSELMDWVNHYQADDNLRLLSGGPGCGKSSFCKMFASAVIANTAVKVLFVPLHLFDLSADLVEAVAGFVSQNRFLDGNP